MSVSRLLTSSDGIAQCYAHAAAAEAAYAGWVDGAMKFAREFAESHDTFMTEEIREYAEKRGLPESPHHRGRRAWGAIILKAKSDGIVKKVGVGTTSALAVGELTTPTYASIWKSLIYSVPA